MFSLISLLAVIAILGIIAVVALRPFSADCPPTRTATSTTTTLVGDLPPGLTGQIQTCH